jgi:hypothetical protein
MAEERAKGIKVTNESEINQYVRYTPINPLN